VTRALQPSLFDDAAEGPRLGELSDGLTRRELTDGAWIDLRPGWLTGSEELFTTLAEGVPWRAERRQMYDRMVDVPRTRCFPRLGPG